MIMPVDSVDDLCSPTQEYKLVIKPTLLNSRTLCVLWFGLSKAVQD